MAEAVAEILGSMLEKHDAYYSWAGCMPVGGRFCVQPSELDDCSVLFLYGDCWRAVAVDDLDVGDIAGASALETFPGKVWSGQLGSQGGSIKCAEQDVVMEFV